jgi:hypothetical protein
MSLAAQQLGEPVIAAEYVLSPRAKLTLWIGDASFHSGSLLGQLLLISSGRRRDEGPELFAY